MPLRRPPSLDLAVRGAALQVTLTDIVYEDPALLDDDSDDEDDDDEAQKDPLLALETIVVSIVSEAARRKSRRLRAEVSAEVTGLTLCYATYDARFRDTNLKEVPRRGRGRVRRGRAASPATKPRSLVYRGVHFRNLAGKTRRAVALWRAAPRDHTTAGRDRGFREELQVPHSNVRLDPGPGGARRGERWI